MKKIFIINWKWIRYPEDNNQKQIYSSGENKLIITKYTINEVKNFNDRIKSIVEVEKPEELLVLTHANRDSDICIPENCISVLSNDKMIMKIREFRGSHNNYIYCSDNNKTGILNKRDLSQKDAIIIENYGETWDYYWNELELEYQKKMIIKLWLPLAIDIQGLSEVQNDTVKADEYLAEVNNETEYLESLKSFPEDDDFPRWAEIRDKNGYKEFDFKKFLDALTNNDFGLLLNSTNYLRVEKEETEEIKKLKNEVAELEKKSNEEEYEKKKKELEEKMKNPNFLPNWLQDVVGVIDEKIKESSKPKD